MCAAFATCPPLAGEFCIVPQPGAPGGHRLVIDNNSGTYAPKSGQLGLMAQLFTANFPDMVRARCFACGCSHVAVMPASW